MRCPKCTNRPHAGGGVRARLTRALHGRSGRSCHPLERPARPANRQADLAKGVLPFACHMAVLPDGRHCPTGGEDGTVHVWNLATGKQTGQWNGHEGPISDIAVSADGRLAVTCGHDHTVILWDVATGSQVRQFPVPGQDRAQCVAIVPDGNVLAAGKAGQLVLWNASTGAHNPPVPKSAPRSSTTTPSPCRCRPTAGAS